MSIILNLAMAWMRVGAEVSPMGVPTGGSSELIGALAAAARNPVEGNSAEGSSPRIISVSGVGQVSVVPDEVNIALGVETFDASLAAAKKENDDRMGRLVKIAPGFGIAASGVRLDPVYVEPYYEARDGRRQLQGYYVRRRVEMTLTDLTKFEALMSSAIEAGANCVHAVNFDVRASETLQQEARRLAIKDAQSKARSVADDMGVALSRPQTITESYSGSYCAYNAGWGNVSWARGGKSAELRGAAAGDAAYTFGRVDITVTIGVTFELK